jgi:hypothetical protein
MTLLVACGGTREPGGADGGASAGGADGAAGDDSTDDAGTGCVTVGTEPIAIASAAAADEYALLLPAAAGPGGVPYDCVGGQVAIPR